MASDQPDERHPLLEVLAPSPSSAVSQTLAGETYTIDPSRVEDKKSVWPVTKALKTAVTIALAPVAVVTGAVATTVMFLSPVAIQERIASFFIAFTCSKLDELFGPERRELLRNCSNNAGRVLDIGTGGGAYLRYFKDATEIVALEPMVPLHDKIRKEADAQGIPSDRLTLLAMGAEEYYLKLQQSEEGEKALFDWIILGNVLCEIPTSNRASVLRAVDTLLHPETGHIYFSEHVGCPQGTWRRCLQDWINPFWRTLSHGCNCNHDSVLDIQSVPHWDVVAWTYHKVRVGLGPFVMGLARKKKAIESTY